MALHPAWITSEWASCHVISIVSIFRCHVMKRHYVMSKISSAFCSQSRINPVYFSPYGTILLTRLARIRTAAILYYPSTSLNCQRYQVISLSLQSTFHQDVFTLTEWLRFCRPWAWSFLELSINSMLDLWVLARICFFRCILASIALLQPDLGHLEASSEPVRFNRVVVYSPTWECIQCTQCHCVRCMCHVTFPKQELLQLSEK